MPLSKDAKSKMNIPKHLFKIARQINSFDPRAFDVYEFIIDQMTLILENLPSYNIDPQTVPSQPILLNSFAKSIANTFINENKNKDLTLRSERELEDLIKNISEIYKVEGDPSKQIFGEDSQAFEMLLLDFFEEIANEDINLQLARSIGTELEEEPGEYAMWMTYVQPLIEEDASVNIDRYIMNVLKEYSSASELEDYSTQKFISKRLEKFLRGFRELLPAGSEAWKNVNKIIKKIEELKNVFETENLENLFEL